MRVCCRKPTNASAGKRTQRKKVSFTIQHAHARRTSSYAIVARTALLFSASAGDAGSGSGSSDDEVVQGEAKAVALAKVEAFKGQQNITVQEVDL